MRDPSAELQAATLRRVTRRLIPFMFALYIANFLDRVNVSFAALQMNRDLGFSSAAYGLGAGIFFPALRALTRAIGPPRARSAEAVAPWSPARTRTRT